MRWLASHRNSVVLLAARASAPLAAAQAPATETRTDLVVLSEGRAIGTESVTVAPTADGWTISASETVGPPVNLSTSKFELRYTRDWRPVSLAIQGTLGNRSLSLSTTVDGGTAVTRGTQQGEPIEVSQPVSPQAVLLPAGFFASYAGLAAQLGSASVGSAFQLYILPQGEVAATVTRITPRRFLAPSGAVDIRQFDLALATSGAASHLEVWVDDRNRLARVSIGGSGLVVIRHDLSAATTREETVSRAGDQEVLIPALGFTIAGTLSTPSGDPVRAPAVLLVGGADSEDRDEVTARVPVFGHLANAIADAGFMVLRYDQRGAARSGGRTESATLADYAGDAVGLVKWLRKRKDVDPDRVAVIGYAEGGAMAMLAAAREDEIAAVGLLASPGQTGRDITLMQQRHGLALLPISDEDRQARISQQERVIDAVVTGTGWDTIPESIRRQADTPWFKSWLLFDPAAVMPKIKRPVLILTGALDTEFPSGQADALEAQARARKKQPASATQKIIVPGVNHLLVSARTGTTSEYADLSGAALAPAVTTAVTGWLKAVLPPRK